MLLAAVPQTEPAWTAKIPLKVVCAVEFTELTPVRVICIVTVFGVGVGADVGVTDPVYAPVAEACTQVPG